MPEGDERDREADAQGRKARIEVAALDRGGEPAVIVAGSLYDHTTNFLVTLPRAIFGGGPSFLRGDANRDGALDLSDPIAILFLLFAAETLPCAEAADANDDGRLDISDPIFLLRYLFLGGERPPEPFLKPGPDPTPDALGCSG